MEHVHMLNGAYQQRVAASTIMWQEATWKKTFKKMLTFSNCQENAQAQIQPSFKANFQSKEIY